MLYHLWAVPSIAAESPVRLTKADCQAIADAAEAQAIAEVSALRVPAGAKTKMHIACVDRDGKIVTGTGHALHTLSGDKFVAGAPLQAVQEPISR